MRKLPQREPTEEELAGDPGYDIINHVDYEPTEEEE